MSAARLFGTDGIRGIAGRPPLDAATVYAVGRALADDLAARRGAAREVILGEDTRESSRWIGETLAAGLEAGGFHTSFAGLLPTPGVAFLTHSRKAAAGVMISASHNPFQDNGIKIFGPDGFKLPDAEEARMEAAIADYLGAGVVAARQALAPAAGLRDGYIEFLLARVAGVDFSRLHVVVDCANGAACELAGQVCERIGLRARLLETAPDGRNINAGSGALHPENMAQAVRDGGFDAGVALDGDADRAILADAGGRIVNGDAVLLMVARDMAARGELDPAVVVGTVMTNLGLELALAEAGVQMERSAVGDRHVLERMQATGAQLGGEPSGHIIFGGEHTTGDGLLTALRCFDLMARRQRTLAELAGGWTALPQKIVNIRVRERAPLERLQPVQAAIRAAEQYFDGQGRVLVRYSGTEMLARVMVEAKSRADVDRHAQAIAEALRREVGAG